MATHSMIVLQTVLLVVTAQVYHNAHLVNLDFLLSVVTAAQVEPVLAKIICINVLPVQIALIVQPAVQHQLELTVLLVAGKALP